MKLTMVIAKIPETCPLARTIRIANRQIVIPPLCKKLNPFYNQVMGLRQWAINQLEDPSP